MTFDKFCIEVLSKRTWTNRYKPTTKNSQDPNLVYNFISVCCFILIKKNPNVYYKMSAGSSPSSKKSLSDLSEVT